ncbi:redoxin domain-containing protein [candidate division KSB1 bacterium]|nr:redoxin domain-containing protein [candidate division KSB1 bacterium]
MSEIFDSIADVAQWLFLTSVKSTVIIALIMIIRLLFRDRLSAQWRHALWFLLVIRLMLPVDLPSDISIYNLAPKVQYRPAPSARDKWTGALRRPASTPSPIASNAPTATFTEHPVEQISNSMSLANIMISIWLIVALGILFYAILVNFNLRFNLKKSQLMLDKKIVGILERCKQRMNVNIPIFVYTTSGINSPFWYGFLRPRIFIPVHLLDSLSEKNLEHIFLHELAHYKRFDLQVALLQTILQSLYWFNPFVWYSFWKMRADRELACDELVLKILGKEESDSYGRTLVSLLKSVKHNRIVPVTIGLSDDRHNLKRRVKMITNFTKKPVIWSIIGLVVFVLAASTALTSAKVGNVHATITVRGEQPEQYHIGIYNPRMNDDLRVPMGEPLDFRTTVDNQVTFNLEPGRYAIVAWAFGYEYEYQNFIVPDNKTEFQFEFELAPKGLPETYEKVLLIGDFCAWEVNGALPMKKDGDIWRITPSTGMRMGTQYKFIIDIPGPHPPGWVPYLYRYSPAFPSAEVVKDYTTFNHVRDTEEIIFDPGVYVTPMQEGQVVAKGSKTSQQYVAFMDKFIDFMESVSEAHQSLRQENPVQWYHNIKDEFDSFAQDYPKPLHTILYEEWFDDYSWYHPFLINMRDIYKAGADSTQLQALFLTREFEDYVDDMIAQLEHINMSSPLFDGEITNCLLYIDHFINEAPHDVQDKLPIRAGHFEAMLLDFTQSKKHPANEKVLYEIIRLYVQRTEREPEYAEKAKDLFARIRKEHPDGWYVKNVIDKLANELRLLPGAPAPDFEVETLSGRTFKLSDQRGKFVFIDFWGTWCGPCRGETPNMLKLEASVSHDSLVVLGLARDDEKSLKAYITEEKVTYPNAILPEEVETQFGINAYPTTFLLDPNGKIIAKNLRGARLVELVREKISEYYSGVAI